jgi:hypothetical protein
MRLSINVVRCACVISLLATTAIAQSVSGQTASNDSSRDEPSFAFGVKILDIALTIDAAAQQTLLAASNTDVPAMMTFRDESHVDQTYQSTSSAPGDRPEVDHALDS